MKRFIETPDSRVPKFYLRPKRFDTVWVVNGVVQSTVLDLAVNSAVERGLLGIALHPDFKENGFVYLYWTCRAPSFRDDCAGGTDDTADLAQVPLLGNRVDRFKWDG